MSTSQVINVALSAGHGGTDKANGGPHGYNEADRMLVLSKILLAEFKRQPNFNVMNIRESDVYIDLYSRCKKAAAFKADILFDLHTNAATPTAGFGSEVIHANASDKDFALKISTLLATQFSTVNRGAKTRVQSNGLPYYGMLRHSLALGIKRPFIVESLFHDKDREAKILMDDKNLKIIASIICKATCEEYGFKYIPEVVAAVKPTVPPTTPTTNTSPQIDPYIISAWAVPSKDFLVKHGITDGSSPLGNVTREQMWVMTAKTIEFILESVKSGATDELLAELAKVVKK